MRSWRVFWDFPNVITLHILAVKVVDLTDTVDGSNPLIFPLAVRTIGKPSPYFTMFRCGHLKHNENGERTTKNDFYISAASINSSFYTYLRADNQKSIQHYVNAMAQNTRLKRGHSIYKHRCKTSKKEGVPAYTNFWSRD